MYKRITAVLTALIFTVVLVPGIALAESSFPASDMSDGSSLSRTAYIDGTPAEDPCARRYYYEQLGAASQALYDAIITSDFVLGPRILAVTADLSGIPRDARTVTSRFTFETGSDQRTYWNTEDSRLVYDTFIEPALAALNFDHPEFGWLDGTQAKWSWTTDYIPRGGDVQSFAVTSLTYEMAQTGLEQATADCADVTASYRYDCADTGDIAALERALERAKNGIGGRNGRTDAEMLRAIHNWLCGFADYADKSKSRYLNDWRGYQTAYSALVRGETVCAGYAKAFKLLSEQYGIPCVLVEGTSRGEQHMWNYVQVDGTWYGVDCTWDDTDSTAEQTYEYFLQGSADFGDHTEGCVWDRLPFCYPVISAASYYSPAQDAGATSHFRFQVVEDADAAMTDALCAALEACRTALERDFAEEFAQPAAVKIYPSVWSMESEGFPTSGGTQFAAHKAGTSQIAVLSTRSDPAPSMEDVTTHARRSYASFVLRQLGAGSSTNRWLARGLELYADGRDADADAIREDVAAGQVPRLSDLVSSLWAMDHLDEYYEVGVMFVTHRYGFDVLREMLRGRSLPSATGVAMSELERQWDMFVRSVFTDQPTLSAGSAYRLCGDGDSRMLAGIVPGTAMNQIVAAFDTPHGTSVHAAVESASAATGQRLIVTNLNGAESDIVLVVDGDVLGTGEVNLSQLVAVAAAFAGTRRLEGPYLAAANWSGTGRISLTDLVHEAEIVRNAHA